MNVLVSRIKNNFSGENISFQFVVSVVVPVIVDQFFLVSFNFVNTAMISSSGTNAVSAVNMVGSLNIFLANLFISVGMGGTVLISHLFGRRDVSMLRKMVVGTIYGTFLVASVLSFVFLSFNKFILLLLFGNAEVSVINYAKIYFIGLLISYPMLGFIEGINATLRGIGQTRYSLKISLIINIIYILFNFVTIKLLKMGILGLVISLNIARIIGVFLAVQALYVNRAELSIKHSNFVHLESRSLLKVLKTSIPFATESLFFNGGKIIIQIFVVSFGTNIIAANAISSSCISLSEIIPNALSIAIVPIIGQCIGRKEIADARKLIKSFLLLGMSAFICVDCGILPFFNLEMKLFNPPEVIVPLIFHIYLIVLVMHFLVWSFSFVLPAALRAAGDANFTTVVSMISMWLFRIIIGYIVGVKLGYGLVGIYIVMTVEWGIRGVIFLKRFHSSRWYSHELI